MEIFIILLVLVAILGIIFYSFYVPLIKLKNKVQESLSGIDVQLKKRSDLIPNILGLASKFMTHERSLIEDITKIRTEVQKMSILNKEEAGKVLDKNSELSTKLNQLFVSLENYPQLKSDSTIIQAQQTYAEVEEHISAARRFYNSAVNELNNSIEIFPSSIVASLLGMKKMELFKILDEKEREVIKVSDYLK